MRTLLRRRTAIGDLTDDQRRITWQAASLLLDYPDDDLVSRLDLVHRGSDALPSVLAEPLRRTVAELASAPLSELQAEYVETFDRRRQHALFLTYFTHGDTRRRGMALLRFAEAYAASGYVLTAAELPDHLCVVLEYGATVDAAVAHRLLCDHRAGLEVLRRALVGEGARWAGALEAVCATLPALAGDEAAAVEALIAAGPPEEEVGLTPYGTPGFDVGPAVPAPAAPVDLPMPGLRRG
ncbi:nitrate reductase molybdenum cofactor assembly chaperone [Sporichthya polymorpha]|uniref:nitrate reductase molybdenum cofactor assembly chaperone n=1 Tax=Sporichthya polymorpha TaxID=35751 RepID=UPI0003751804|nr:nitrate reductase molybdenum cofactor assembly chaperone [Sporichthya polymorpha]